MDGMKKHTRTPEQKAKQAKYYAEWRSKNKERVKGYLRKYYQEKREKVLQQQREYDARTPERKNRRHTPEYDKEYRRRHPQDRRDAKEYRRRRRKELLGLLGGKCEKCGIDDWRVLQIDHINGGGRKERASGYDFNAIRRDVLEHGREKYQVLCANCHALKTYGDE